jgi:hypothetical protein
MDKETLKQRRIAFLDDTCNHFNISNTSGKWKAYPKLGDTIYVNMINKNGFSPIELEPLEIIELINDKNAIIVNNHGVELPVTFKCNSANDIELIAYFAKKED